jgi:hypothetical protein
VSLTIARSLSQSLLDVGADSLAREVQDKEGDDDVLDSEEEVLPIGGEGEMVARRVGERDRVRGCFKDLPLVSPGRDAMGTPRT